MAAELNTGAEAPDDVLTELLHLLHGSKELSAKGKRAADAALVILTRTEKPTAAKANTNPVAVAAALAAPVIGFVLSLRAGAAAAPLIALVLWRGVSDRALIALAGVLLAVGVPVAYLLAGFDDRHGFNTYYAVEHRAGHWLAVAALIALGVALARTLVRPRPAPEPRDSMTCAASSGSWKPA